MWFSVALSIALLALPTNASILPRQGNNRNGGGGAGNNNNNNNNNGGGGAAAGGAGNAGNAGNANPQTSLTLDTRVIATNYASNGQDPPVAGQSPSLTTTNNYINFCLTVPQLPITNGRQVSTGSCNPSPMGVIPSVDRMPACKFSSPKNGDVIASDTAFTINMVIQNLQTGAFTNPQETYFKDPQTLNGQGIIIGHSHVTIQALTSLDQATPLDPRQFAFFKGLNNAAANGVLSADVTSGLPAGAYRLCSINSASTHQPVVVPVAQHGALDDCVYFTATPGGAAAGGNGGAGGAGAGNAGAGAGAGGNAGGANNGGAGAGGANNGGAGAGGNNAAPPAATGNQQGGNRQFRSPFRRPGQRN